MCNSNNDYTNNNKENRAALPDIKCKVDSFTYEIGKKVFIVTPTYRENTDKTVYSSLLNLMIKDTENY